MVVKVIEELRSWDPYVAQAGHNLRMEIGDHRSEIGSQRVWGMEPEVKGHGLRGQIN